MMPPIDDNTHSHDDIFACIQAMRRQEDEVSTCINYLQFSYNKSVDVNSRTAMVTWCQQLQKKFKLSPETASFAISFFDRYLSSGKGKSRQALQDKYQFQLVSLLPSTSLLSCMKRPSLLSIHRLRSVRGIMLKKISLRLKRIYYLLWTIVLPLPCLSTLLRSTLRCY